MKTSGFLHGLLVIMMITKLICLKYEIHDSYESRFQIEPFHLRPDSPICDRGASEGLFRIRWSFLGVCMVHGFDCIADVYAEKGRDDSRREIYFSSAVISLSCRGINLIHVLNTCCSTPRRTVPEEQLCRSTWLSDAIVISAAPV